MTTISDKLQAVLARIADATRKSGREAGTTALLAVSKTWPASAVRDTESAAPWVLLWRDGQAVRQPVKLGLRGVGEVEIAEGLSVGDEAIPQTEKALPGDRVRRGAVMNNPASAPKAP